MTAQTVGRQVKVGTVVCETKYEDNRHTFGYDCLMKPVNWNTEKNIRLKLERGVSFEEVLAAMSHGALLDVVAHPNTEHYPNQRIYVIRIRGYAYLVPFVESDKEIFLKTIMPSRIATKKYLLEGINHEK
jgi:hypothetical protein